MKKVIVIIICLLFFVITNYLVITSDIFLQINDGLASNKISYLIADKQNLSLNPIHSDYSLNQALLDPLLGTLVKYSYSGKLEPYLAEYWNKSNDGLTWKFRLRENLSCEDGYPINAQNFIISLNRSIRSYLKKSKVMELDKLIGFNEFKSGTKNIIEGLLAEDDLTIVFNFSAPPENLLNYLRMPYFGFYSPNNFDENGKWKSNKNIVSSASYKIIESEDRRFLLEKRKGWFLISNESIQYVEFKFLDDHDQPITNDLSIIHNPSHKLSSNGFSIVKGTPTFLGAMVLTENDVFKEKKRRLNFLSNIRLNQEKIKFSSRIAQYSNSFYPSQEKTVGLSSGNISVNQADILRVYIPERMPEEERKYLRLLIEKSLDGVSEKVVYVSPPSSKEYYDKVDEDSWVDIKFVGVDIGGKPSNSTIKMMFCTSLGVKFPDPSGRVCDLVREYEHPNRSTADLRYINQFNKIIEEDCVIIPIMHLSKIWYYSSKIDPKSIMPIPNYPRFELLRVQ